MSEEHKDELIFSQSPAVHFGSNLFINVPTILQYEDTPLIQVGQIEAVGFSYRIPIFNKDGVHLAVVVGSQLYLTPEGQKSGLSLRHPPNMTVCELDKETLFEVRRVGPAALKTEAELYTPDGRFIRGASNVNLLNIDEKGTIKFGESTMSSSAMMGFKIAFLVKSDGNVLFGVS